MSNSYDPLYSIYFGLGGSDFDVRYASKEEQEKAIFALVRSLEADAFFKGAASMKRRSADEAQRLKASSIAGDNIEKAIRELPISENGDER